MILFSGIGRQVQAMAEIQKLVWANLMCEWIVDKIVDRKEATQTLKDKTSI